MLLKNGFLINPKTHTQELTDIRILNGKISQISAGLVPENSEEVLDLTGLTVALRKRMHPEKMYFVIRICRIIY